VTYMKNAMNMIAVAVLVTALVAGCMGTDTQPTSTTGPAPKATAQSAPKATVTTSAPAGQANQGQTPTTETNPATGGTNPPTQETTPTTAAAPAGQFIAKAADVAAGTTFDFTYNGEKATLVNFNGEYMAFVNNCPHMGTNNIGLAGGVLRCPRHGSTFSPTDGSLISGPAKTGLRTISVVVSGDGVYAQ